PAPRGPRPRVGRVAEFGRRDRRVPGVATDAFAGADWLMIYARIGLEDGCEESATPRDRPPKLAPHEDGDVDVAGWSCVPLGALLTRWSEWVDGVQLIGVGDQHPAVRAPIGVDQLSLIGAVEDSG